MFFVIVFVSISTERIVIKHSTYTHTNTNNFLVFFIYLRFQLLFLLQRFYMRTHWFMLLKEIPFSLCGKRFSYVELLFHFFFFILCIFFSLSFFIVNNCLFSTTKNNNRLPSLWLGFCFHRCIENNNKRKKIKKNVKFSASSLIGRWQVFQADKAARRR